MRPSTIRLLKQSTNLTGFVVHTNPLPALVHTYQATLTGLGHLPPSSAYRQASEALTQHRLAVVQDAMKAHGVTVDKYDGDRRPGEGDEAVGRVEKALGGPTDLQVEQLLDIARREETLVARMIDWKA